LVIGVVADARFEGLDRDPVHEVYLPGVITNQRTGLLFHVRTKAAADKMLPGIIRDLSAQGLRVDRAATHAGGLFESLKGLALPAWLFGALAAASLMVIMIGVWGLLAMSAAQRTRELGVRIALGATRRTLVRMLVREQLTAVTRGLLGGAILGAWLVTFLRSQLYGLGPYSPVAWTAAALALLTLAVVATTIPAIRATAADPGEVLRAE
jgi:ABC-type antimicrobial peptide transport system permease subunit